MDKSYDLILQSIKYIWKYTEGCPFLWPTVGNIGSETKHIILQGSKKLLCAFEI